MKILFYLILITISFCCNHLDSNSPKSGFDTLTRDLIKELDSLIPKESENVKTIKRNPDTTILLKISHDVLKAIKNRNYNKFASFIHPINGVLFSPYAYIDTTDSQVLSSERFIELSKNKKKINWDSTFDPDMSAEMFTLDEYLKKYVYDVDFLNAPVIFFNRFRSRGTDLNNIFEIFPDSDIAELYFPGFQEKYSGHDFRGLRLVFQYYYKKPYLVAVVHDQWTP